MFFEFYQFTIAWLFSKAISKDNNKQVTPSVLTLTKKHKKSFLRQVIKSKTKKANQIYKCQISITTESTCIKLAKKEGKRKSARIFHYLFVLEELKAYSKMSSGSKVNVCVYGKSCIDIFHSYRHPLKDAPVNNEVCFSLRYVCKTTNTESKVLMLSRIFRKVTLFFKICIHTPQF